MKTETTEKNEMISTVEHRIGKRTTVTKNEMAAILMALHERDGVTLANAYVPDTTTGSMSSIASAWTRQCDGITCVGVTDRRRVVYGDPAMIIDTVICFAPAGVEHTMPAEMILTVE
jgi:hypothetical protein